MPRYDTMVEAAKYMTPTDSLTYVIIVLFFVTMAVIFIGGNYVSRYLAKKQIKEHFFRLAYERELSETEAALMWDIGRSRDSEAALMFEYKAPFEKSVDRYVADHGEEDEKRIGTIRKKLGYTNLPSFIPLFFSKDIELYQGGRMKFEGQQSAEVMLFDKDEKYMYWLLHNEEKPVQASRGQPVHMTFLREGDAIYHFDSVVDAMLDDRGRAVVRLPHTYEMQRNQRRELSRVACECKAQILLQELPDLDAQEEEQSEALLLWHDGLLTDISASGAKFELHPSEEEAVDARIDQAVTVRFALGAQEIVAPAKVASIKRQDDAKQYGLQFVDLENAVSENIYNFVLAEQKKFAQLMRFQREF